MHLQYSQPSRLFVPFAARIGGGAAFSGNGAMLRMACSDRDPGGGPRSVLMAAAAWRTACASLALAVLWWAVWWALR